MKREFHRSAGIVLHREDGGRRFLLLRSALTRRPVWEFPKGAIEAGESELQAALRELEEETALGPGCYELHDGFRAEEHYHFLRGPAGERRLIRKVVAYFLAEWRAGEVRISPEATRFTWAAPAEAVRLLRFPEKRRVLASALRYLDEPEAPSGGARPREDVSPRSPRELPPPTAPGR